ncbi:MAG: GNAT family N-acetyltransferase [Phycicoccus sp.]|nr:GNAT family N-acetyltransferase [Phycicoccus sp.]
MATDVRALTLGTRVVIRYRLDGPNSAGHTLTDVVGPLRRIDDATVVVQGRSGAVEVSLDRVVAAKVVPPRPTRRGAPHLTIGTDDLERVMIDAWPAPERSPLGDWVLRAGRGFTHRANSVATPGSPGMPLDEAVTAVEDWYAARGLPPDLVVTGPVGFAVAETALGALLLDRGYLPREPTIAYTAAAREVGARPVDPAVELSGTLTDEWLTAFGSYRDLDIPAARAILTGSPDQIFAQVRGTDGIVGIGRLALAHGWGGIAAMWVSPTVRRHGIAGAMLTSLARAAASQGVLSLHLQTDALNAAARAAYEGRGFVAHHAYANVAQPR